MKINSLEDLKNMPTEVRVLANTSKRGREEMDKMVGGIFKQRSKHDYDKTRSIWNKDKSDFWWFNESELQELTPLEYNGHRIGIGDWVYAYGEWHEVYGYYWYDNEFRLNTAKIEKNKPNYSNCWNTTLQGMTDIKPLYKKEEDDATTQAIELLKNNGYKIIKG